MTTAEDRELAMRLRRVGRETKRALEDLADMYETPQPRWSAGWWGWWMGTVLVEAIKGATWMLAFFWVARILGVLK